MASTSKAPKQWSLSKHETVNSFENWKQNLLYTLTLDPNFAPFLSDEVTWAKKSKSSPVRGFEDDADSVPTACRKTAVQKCAMLDLMLGQIANYCPVISRSSIVKNSVSLNDIWGKVRLHYGFQNTGAHFLDFCDIRLEPDERPEDLYQRLVAFVEDSLLTVGGGITHHGESITEDEELTPSLENFVVLHWLQLVHEELPRLVKQRYGTELRSRSLASLKPEISQALGSLLDEIRSSDLTRAMRTTPSLGFTRTRTPTANKTFSNLRSQQKPGTFKSCPLCKQAGRPDSHFLSKCKYLPQQDKRYLAKVRQIAHIIDVDSEDTSDNESDIIPQPEYPAQCSAVFPERDSSTLRIQIRQSPYFDAFCRHHAVRITLDTGATGNMVRASTVHALGGKITSSSQSAHQADGRSPLAIIGETHITFSRDDKQFVFEGLVVENLDVEVLAGTPFMELNDIAVRPAKREIRIGDSTVLHYGSTKKGAVSHTHSVRRAHVLRAPPTTTVLWPGDFVEVPLPAELSPTETLALEPRVCSKSTPSPAWPPPCIISNVAGKVRIPNLSSQPLLLHRNAHFCQVRPVSVVTPEGSYAPGIPPPTVSGPPCPSSRFGGPGCHSQSVSLDPDNILPDKLKRQFHDLHEEYDDVFDPNFGGYNGAAGPFEAVVNMGPVQPPQRKGRLPLYARNTLVELQDKFDELESLGVFARPEDVGVTVEYLNPSFLVKKPNGGFRLVTAFADVGRYAKPQPSLMPDVDSTLRKLGQWKYLITTDLTSAFYQVPLSKKSMKYCGVATPYRGVRVYTRSAMGMPGSETALEELMCRVLGDLLKEGVVVKLADDLYCGGNTPDDLLLNWSRVLHALQVCGLRLSARKTIVCPKSANILGWVWSQGTLHASSHRVAALSSCSPPSTVKGMRSFIGAYKMLARVLPQCAVLLSPLDNVVAGRQSNDRISWSDDLHASFSKAQDALSSTRSITLPRPSDHLWIVTDGSMKKYGLGATLYVTRDSKPSVAGYFSAKLRRRQMTWLPCEIEALSIAVSCKHFAPYIIQSHHNTSILTDSKPCVQAFEKLCRGEFSASPRVSTFLSAVSRFQCTVRHVSGCANIPSDFASRNAPECTDPSCQICLFIRQTEDSVVLRVTTEDILSGHAKLPFTSRPAWISIQRECPDLRRTHAYLLQGTRPSRKMTKIKDIKRYLQSAAIARDGLLVVRRDQPFSPPRECIVVPRNILDGLLTSLHLQLDHPTYSQLKSVVNRYFFALDMDSALQRVTGCCHQCASLRSLPSVLTPQSTGDPPDAVGVSFAADVIRRSRQMIFLLRECTTSFTSTCFITDERQSTLRDALIRLCVSLRPLNGPPAVIRTDCAPGFASLCDDPQLLQLGISIELGHSKNPNKNPVAEKAVRELEDELLRFEPSGGAVSPVTLSLATARLNSRLQSRGLSAREMWYQRDQFTGDQLPIHDADLIRQQHSQRVVNHPHSERAKTTYGSLPPSEPIVVGDLVYLRRDRDKTHTRPRYIVTSVDGDWCNIRKFTGHQLRNFSYRVKSSDCLKVLGTPESPPSPLDTGTCPPDDEDCPPPLSPQPHASPAHPPPPDIPLELSDPPGDDPPLPSADLPSMSQDPVSTPPPVSIASGDFPPGSASQRPQRAHRVPSRFKDFVLY